MAIWQLQEAKSRFSEVVDLSLREGPQTVTRRGEAAVVVLSVKEYRRLTGETPRLWGDSIVGFGSYHYAYASGREGDWFVTGFSPRKQNLTLYAAGGFEPHTALLAKLGKHKLGKGCLYINKLQDVDQEVLRALMTTVEDEAQKP